MKTVSMLELRQDAQRIIDLVRKGQAMVLTYRGKPAIRLEPLADVPIEEGDPFYGLDRLADTKGKSLTNQQMDKLIYGG